MILHKKRIIMLESFPNIPVDMIIGLECVYDTVDLSQYNENIISICHKLPENISIDVKPFNYQEFLFIPSSQNINRVSYKGLLEYYNGGASYAYFYGGSKELQSIFKHPLNYLYRYQLDNNQKSFKLYLNDFLKLTGEYKEISFKTDDLIYEKLPFLQPYAAQMSNWLRMPQWIMTFFKCWEEVLMLKYPHLTISMGAKFKGATPDIANLKINVQCLPNMSVNWETLLDLNQLNDTDVILFKEKYITKLKL